MIEHKAFECEFCGREFEADEYITALAHENNCHCNPKHMKCGSCKHGKPVIAYEMEHIRCDKLKSPNHSCGDWKNK